VKASDRPPASSSADRLRLLTISHRKRVRVVPLPAAGSLSLGRGEECDVQLSGDPLISRRHALLHVHGRLFVEDLGSQNGTRILSGRAGADASAPTASSPERLRPEVPTPLPDGATVQLGNTLLAVDVATLAPGRDVDVAGVVVADARMRHLYALLERVASRQINVLLLGETGVGKDVFARRVHALSARAAAPFLGINCGALSESLLESELFGHEKGAFTGAYAAKPGLFEAAAGGVAFLDEVGELPLNLQVKLLRVLEDRTVLRVGAVRPTPIDVRIVAATNRDLDRAVAAGLFRSDLYYRLDGISFVIPPLRERAAEILPLASLWLQRFGEKEGRPTPPRLSAEAAQKLTSHPWPGNVRELRNVIERALVLCDGAFVRAEHIVLAPAAGFSPALPPLPRAHEPPQPTLAPPPPSASAAAFDLSPFGPPSSLPPQGADASPLSTPTEQRLSADNPAKLRQRADELEREHLRATLEACAGNQSLAAARLGVTRRVLIRRLERFQLTRPKKS
jgi:two-component system, NtrC family, response regulator AtoC